MAQTNRSETSRVARTDAPLPLPDQQEFIRARIVEQAKRVLPPALNLDSMSERQIQEVALKQLDPTLDFSGKSDAYVAGYFEFSVDRFGSSQNVPASTRSDGGATPSLTEARKKLRSRSMPPGWLPVYMRPLSASTGPSDTNDRGLQPHRQPLATSKDRGRRRYDGTDQPGFDEGKALPPWQRPLATSKD